MTIFPVFTDQEKWKSAEKIGYIKCKFTLAHTEKKTHSNAHTHTLKLKERVDEGRNQVPPSLV